MGGLTEPTTPPSNIDAKCNCETCETENQSTDDAALAEKLNALYPIGIAIERSPRPDTPPQLSQDDALAVHFGLLALGLKKLMGKRVDYSGKTDPYKNLRTSASRGVEPWRGVMVRCEDKISRRTQFMETGGEMIITDESFSDPYFDHINYICIEAGLAIETLGRFDILEMLRGEAKDLIGIIKEIGKDVI